MTMSAEPCVCGYELKPHLISHLLDFETSVLVIRNVPVMLCGKCGYKLFDDQVVENIEKMEQDFKRRNDMIEVTNYKDVA